MKIKNILLIICTLTVGILLAASCANNKMKSEGEIVIHANTSKAGILDYGDFEKDFITRIEYTALETIDESLIGNIEKVYLHKDNIIVFDLKPNRILLFGKNGKFIRQIGRQGSGPDEYSRLNDVFFEESTGLIYAHERLKNMIFVYNLEGEIEDRIKPGFTFNSFCKTEDGFWLYTCFARNNPNGYNLMLVDNSMQTMKGGWFPQNPNFVNVERMNRFRLDSNGAAYFTYPTSNNIYRLNNAMPEIFCTVDFGARTAPYEKIAQIESHEEYQQLLDDDFLLLGNYNIWNNLIIFSFSESALNKPKTLYEGFYNISNSELNIYHGIKTSKELPQNNILCTSDRALIFSAFPYQLDDEHLEFIQSRVNEKLDEDSNPVLIISYP